MVRRGAPAQRELFAPAGPASSLPPEVAKRLIPLLERLLAEVSASEGTRRAGGDEQDRT